MPLRFSECMNSEDLEAPFLGEHNESILSERLGMSSEEIKALNEGKVLIAEAIPA